MKRALLAVGLLAIGAAIGRSAERCLCLLFGHGRPERVWLGGPGSGRGGYRCSNCHKAAATPGELYEQDDYYRGSGRRSA